VSRSMCVCGAADSAKLECICLPKLVRVSSNVVIACIGRRGT
jgi:hypothetical protein